jgi:hypothetical protein
LGFTVVLDPGGGGITPHVQDGARKAAAVLADAGYAAEKTEPPSIAEAAQSAFSMLSTPEIRAVASAAPRVLQSSHPAVTHWVLRRGRGPRPR